MRSRGSERRKGKEEQEIEEGRERNRKGREELRKGKEEEYREGRERTRKGRKGKRKIRKGTRDNKYDMMGDERMRKRNMLRGSREGESVRKVRRAEEKKREDERGELYK